MIKSYISFIKEHMKNKMYIPKDILEINSLFNQAGKELYLVGGCVRDFLTGSKPHDFDLVSNASPDKIVDILKGYRCDLQGKHFGVIRVFTKETPEGIEVATYRKDISKGRDVKGNDKKVDIDNVDIKTDSERRDLTVNSIYYNINTGEIIDFHGGVNDIRNKVIKTVGEPELRFGEDRLRILRIFRFAARSNSTIDKKTAESILKDNKLRGMGLVDDVSQERIVEEFLKMFDYAKKASDTEMFQHYLILLSTFNMWDQMFSGLLINPVFEVSKDYETMNLSIILTNLFDSNDLNTIVRKMISLKFSADISNQVYFLLKFKSDISDISKGYDLLLLKERFHVEEETIEEFSRIKGIDCEKFIKYCLLGITTDGNDLMNQGFTGKALGDEKKKLELEIYKKL